MTLNPKNLLVPTTFAQTALAFGGVMQSTCREDKSSFESLIFPHVESSGPTHS